MAASTRLKALLAAGEFILAPGVFEMFSARIADRMGFKALYMTGYGVSASYLGLADAGLVTYTDMVSRARTIAEGTTTPLIADADTGFGGLINIRQTVRGYEAAGVQGAPDAYEWQEGVEELREIIDDARANRGYPYY